MTKDIVCLAVADIHGNIAQYEKIKRLVAKHSVSLVCLCGDLLPKDGGSWAPNNKIRTIEMQAAFINDYFLKYLEELGHLTTVVVIFGNDDFKSNYPKVKQRNTPNVHFLDNEAIRLKIKEEEVYIAGYPYVGVTPFLHKDWEKRDVGLRLPDYKVYRSDGYVSEKGRHTETDLSDINAHPSTIESDLEKLATMSPPEKTVYLFHEAPFGTPLDMIAPDNKFIKDNELHIGSKAIRKFIEDKQPLVTIHGHIHETFDQSNDFRWVSGKSVSLTPANDFKSGTLSYILFPLSDIKKAKRRSAQATHITH